MQIQTGLVRLRIFTTGTMWKFYGTTTTAKKTVRLRDIVPLNPNEFVNERVAWRDGRNIAGRITSVKKSTGRKGTKRTQSVFPVLGSVENILGTSNPDSVEAEQSAEDCAVVSTADNAGTPCTPRVRQRVVTVKPNRRRTTTDSSDSWVDYSDTASESEATGSDDEEPTPLPQPGLNESTSNQTYSAAS